MHIIDWSVLIGTLFFIVAYGVYKTRNITSTESYLLGDRDLKWWTIGLSVMATQASAITFLSTPGQAYEEGLGFAQFYFGLPIAMVILCIFVLPIFYKLKVYTAYEYLEGRFDLKTRTLTAILFLIQRGMAAGITIFAPSIILSTILGWNLGITTMVIGFVVIFYTVAGGTKAVSQTQKQQMIVILGGMFVAFIILITKLPQDVPFLDALSVAGHMGKLNIIDFDFDPNNKYTIWTGIIGGVFLFLSYFGTDQSQVQRYLSGKSLTESRLGLLFNGIFKVPMQFFILFVGVMVFIFYQFNESPVHFNNANVEKVKSSIHAQEYDEIEGMHQDLFVQKKEGIYNYIESLQGNDVAQQEQYEQDLKSLIAQEKLVRVRAKDVIQRVDEDLDTEDADYIFINFVIRHLPIGLIGLLLAVIFSAAMSSTSSELNALATTSIVDIYKRSFIKDKDDAHYLKMSKIFTVLWGLVALGFAAFASLFENLIEAVNIIGSIFYGTILGIFVVAFFFKKVSGKAVFISAVAAEAWVITVFVLDKMEVLNIAYLWLNLIGCILVVVFSLITQKLLRNKVSTG
jgi:Na+/proline symporter